MNNIERLNNFSDAVMAIAVTLLVLPLTEHASSMKITSYHEFSKQYGHLLFIFALSFFVICRYWEVHHNILNRLKTFDTRIFWVNSCWLLSIALIPFTSEIIGYKGVNNSFNVSIYMGSLLLMIYIATAMQVLITHSPSLLRVKKDLTSPLPPYSTITAIVFTVAFIFGILFPDIGPAFLILNIPVSIVAKHWLGYEKPVLD
jgi:uncharacterized membrane protein